MPSRPCWVMYIHFVWVTPQWFAGWHSFFGATLNTGETWKFTTLFQVRFEIWKGARQPVKQEWPLRKLSRCIEFRVFQYILYRVMKIISKISIHIHVYNTSHRNSPLQRSRLNSWHCWTISALYYFASIIWIFLFPHFIKWHGEFFDRFGQNNFLKAELATCWRVQSSRPLFVGQPRITWEKRNKTGEYEYENMQQVAGWARFLPKTYQLTTTSVAAAWHWHFGNHWNDSQLLTSIDSPSHIDSQRRCGIPNLAQRLQYLLLNHIREATRVQCEDPVVVMHVTCRCKMFLRYL